ncbi:MAG: MaoC family dehydratase N-terminal domain-containing protein [Arenicellales bacterium]
MTTPTLDSEVLHKWIGKSEQRQDSITMQPAQFMQATLDREPSLQNGDALPLGWHWLYFLEARPMSELGRDGHPAVGGFLPPVALPRRMWAGSRLEFHSPIRLGDSVRKVSTIKALKLKSGKSGKLCFVTVLHQYFRKQDKLITEEHDIVYREDPAPGAALLIPPVAGSDAEIQRSIVPSPVLLYRYSALTFNGHRIHYDIDYCRDVEGYPGLVFHGPLSATLLLDLASETAGAETINHFKFRAISPLYADRPFTINLKKNTEGFALWATNPDGHLAINASVVLR